MSSSPRSRSAILGVARSSVPVGRGIRPRRIDVGEAVVRNDAPAVSPDGKQIAFLSGEDAVYEIRALRHEPAP